MTKADKRPEYAALDKIQDKIDKTEAELLRLRDARSLELVRLVDTDGQNVYRLNKYWGRVKGWSALDKQVTRGRVVAANELTRTTE